MFIASQVALTTVPLLSRIHLPMQETQEMHIWSLGQEDPLEKEMATHSQYSCLGNPKDWGDRWAIIHGVAKELDVT